jgi:hypothetical protein
VFNTQCIRQAYLWVIIDHHSLLAELVKRHGCVDGTPVKLDRATNAVDTATQDDDAVVVKGHIVGARIVRRVEVVGVYMHKVSKCRMYASFTSRISYQLGTPPRACRYV